MEHGLHRPDRCCWRCYLIARASTPTDTAFYGGSTGRKNGSGIPGNTIAPRRRGANPWKIPANA